MSRNKKPILSAIPPKGWSKRARSAAVRVISLAAGCITAARGRVAADGNSGKRHDAEVERLNQELALLKEELRIKDARWSRIAPQRRPHYTPAERMGILEMKAARCWSAAQTAEAFHVTEATVSSWMGKLDDGDLVKPIQPINKFPDFVRYAVQRLKTLCPTMGKVKIAETLCRAGLHLGVTTVRRILKESPIQPPEEPQTTTKKESKSVKSSKPNSTWLTDITTVPTALGYWVSWLPFSVPLAWPFCWWVAVAVDHFSRRVMGMALFDKQPTSEEVCRFLNRVLRDAGGTPKRIITDQGQQFDCGHYRRWCMRREIKPCYGAVGQHGSIAITERFILTLKTELIQRIRVPLIRHDLERELSLFRSWFNGSRPHMGISGRTPNEVYFRRKPANAKPRSEPRTKWPRGSPCAKPDAPIKGRRGGRFAPHVRFIEGRKHLPLVTLRRAA